MSKVYDRPDRLKLKTYSHLMGAKRMPTEYELATSKVLYYAERGGFELPTSMSESYRRYQKESDFQCADWERFIDPEELTYTKYTEARFYREIFVENLIRQIADTNYDRQLPPAAVDFLERILPVLRFPIHGLQMLSSYVGQMAPSGRVVIASAFQAADEMRRIQTIALRMALMRQAFSNRAREFGSRAREDWQRGLLWQPLRRLIEMLLVTYDWGEAFVAVNICLKPQFDQLFMKDYPRLLARHRDTRTAEVFDSLYEDCKWHHSWSRALSQVVRPEGERSDVSQAIDNWIRKWEPEVSLALEPIRALTTAREGSARAKEYQ